MNISILLRCINIQNSSKLIAPTRHASIKRAFCQSPGKMSTTASITKAKERDSFQEILPSLIDSLVTHPRLAEVPEVGIWLKKVLDYNLAGGKKNRGLTTVAAYELLEKPENVNEETLRLARIVGWCVEILQAYFLVADDMMDGSRTRRGVSCWYRLPDVGLGAINDCILMYTSFYHILKLHVGHLPQGLDIYNLFNETVLMTSAGQHMDFVTSNRNKNDYSLFTMERYEAIVKHKSSYYTYRLPVFLGMKLANIQSEAAYAHVEDICFDLGKLFQIQDDFIDTYVDETVSGKGSTDIQEGKCSWLAVQALKRCTPQERSVFEKYYGSKDPAHIQRIKQLYDDLDLSTVFKIEEQVLRDSLVAKINGLNQEVKLSPRLFIKLIDTIYKRKQ